MRNVLVTGGGGFVGLAVVRLLREMNLETTVVGRNRYPAAEDLGARCLQGDIRDPAFMLQAAKGMDTVFHVAAKAGVWGDFKSYFSINVAGTRNVIQACREQQVRHLVYTSTPSVVFDGKSICGGDETLPYATNPLCHYAATKIVAEKEVLASNSDRLRTTALRPHLVWGPGDTNLIPRLLERGRKRQLKIIGDGKNKVDISYIDNVANAHILAAKNLASNGEAAGEAFFISQGEPVHLWAWINALFAKMQISPVTKHVSLTTAYKAGWMLEKVYGWLKLQAEPKMTRFIAQQLSHDHWFSIKKAEKMIGYKPQITTDEGLQKLLLALRQENSSQLHTDSV